MVSVIDVGMGLSMVILVAKTKFTRVPNHVFPIFLALLVVAVVQTNAEKTTEYYSMIPEDSFKAKFDKVIELNDILHSGGGIVNPVSIKGNLRIDSGSANFTGKVSTPQSDSLTIECSHLNFKDRTITAGSVKLEGDLECANIVGYRTPAEGTFIDCAHLKTRYMTNRREFLRNGKRDLYHYPTEKYEWVRLHHANFKKHSGISQVSNVYDYKNPSEEKVCGGDIYMNNEERLKVREYTDDINYSKVDKVGRNVTNSESDCQHGGPAFGKIPI